MKARRIGFGIWYALTILLVQVLHDHRSDRGEPLAVALAGCDDPRPHFAGHDAPDLSRSDPHCLACQFRTEHQAIAYQTVDFDESALHPAIDFSRPIDFRQSLTHANSRAPPLS